MGMGNRLQLHCLEVDREYETWGGDVVRCLKDEGEDLFTCEFIRTVGARENLLGTFGIWTARGHWFKMPGGIHDLTGEVCQL